MATIILIVAAVWVAIMLIVLTICRAATRQDKPDDADGAKPRAKVGAVAGRANADGPLDRPSLRE